MAQTGHRGAEYPSLSLSIPEPPDHEGLAKVKNGDREGGNADIAAAKAENANIGGQYARFALNE
jgi:hypothetical protein